MTRRCAPTQPGKDLSTAGVCVAFVCCVVCFVLQQIIHPIFQYSLCAGIVRFSLILKIFVRIFLTIVASHSLLSFHANIRMSLTLSHSLHAHAARSESHLTTLNDKSELLASCVLCAGSLYGGDGGLFHSLQRDAWMWCVRILNEQEIDIWKKRVKNNTL